MYLHGPTLLSETESCHIGQAGLNIAIFLIEWVHSNDILALPLCAIREFRNLECRPFL